MPECATGANRAPRLSVIIATYNGATVIGQQLESLATQEASFAWECVVADNGSKDATLAVVESMRATFPAPLTVVDASAKRGVPFARNRGVAASSGELIVFCDQDDVVQPGWLAAAESGLRKADAVMGLIRRMNYEKSTPARVMNPSVYGPSPIVETCNFGVRREALLVVGGFDENLPHYGMEDSELSVRLRKTGYHITGCPAMEIRARYSTKLRTRVKKIFSSGRAELYMWFKHSDVYGDRLTYGYFWRELCASLRALPAAALGRIPKEQAARRLITALAHIWELPRLL